MNMVLQRYGILVLFILILNSFLSSCKNHTQEKNTDKMANIEVTTGSRAPEFSLPDAEGKTVSLSDFIGKSSLVVFFYPKDESYGCTKEACSFRDHYEVFKEAGAEVIGISADDAASHRSFAKNHRLPFILLSDPDGVTAGKYGVKKTLGLLPGRVTFVIDKQGIVLMRFSSQLNFGKHIEQALQVLKGK